MAVVRGESGFDSVPTPFVRIVFVEASETRLLVVGQTEENLKEDLFTASVYEVHAVHDGLSEETLLLSLELDQVQPLPSSSPSSFSILLPSFRGILVFPDSSSKALFLSLDTLGCDLASCVSCGLLSGEEGCLSLFLSFPDSLQLLTAYTSSPPQQDFQAEDRLPTIEGSLLVEQCFLSDLRSVALPFPFLLSSSLLLSSSSPSSLSLHTLSSDLLLDVSASPLSLSLSSETLLLEPSAPQLLLPDALFASACSHRCLALSSSLRNRTLLSAPSSDQEAMEDFLSSEKTLLFVETLSFQCQVTPSLLVLAWGDVAKTLSCRSFPPAFEAFCNAWHRQSEEEGNDVMTILGEAADRSYCLVAYDVLALMRGQLDDVLLAWALDDLEGREEMRTSCFAHPLCLLSFWPSSSCHLRAYWTVEGGRKSSEDLSSFFPSPPRSMLLWQEEDSSFLLLSLVDKNTITLTRIRLGENESTVEHLWTHNFPTQSLIESAQTVCQSEKAWLLILAFSPTESDQIDLFCLAIIKNSNEEGAASPFLYLQPLQLQDEGYKGYWLFHPLLHPHRLPEPPPQDFHRAREAQHALHLQYIHQILSSVQIGAVYEPLASPSSLYSLSLVPSYLPFPAETYASILDQSPSNSLVLTERLREREDCPIENLGSILPWKGKSLSFQLSPIGMQIFETKERSSKSECVYQLHFSILPSHFLLFLLKEETTTWLVCAQGEMEESEESSTSNLAENQ